MTRYQAGVVLFVVGLGLMATAEAAAAAEPDLTFVSTSGIPHHDVANYTKSKSWRKGMPEGINDSWRQSIDITIGQIASEKPDAVFHTGDMVSGRWGRDTENTGIFGPTRTMAQRERAVERAADMYYRQNKSWWAKHDLRPYFGVGDHEVGDVEPSGMIVAGDFRSRALSVWRDAWGQAFTDNGTRYDSHPPGQHRKTAYATMIGDVGFVSLDPFTQLVSGVHVRIGNRQMRWLGQALDDLRDQGARFLIVQCEVPALNTIHQSHSSRLILQNGEDLWQLLADHGVDLLLTAEFHELSTHTNQGATPVQVVHGGQLYRGNVSYLVINAFDDRMELQLKRMYGEQTGTGKIWAPSRVRATDGLRMYRGTSDVGTMTIHDDGSLSDRSGYLTETASQRPADGQGPQIGRPG
jgi:hypothetical protein